MKHFPLNFTLQKRIRPLLLITSYAVADVNFDTYYWNFPEKKKERGSPSSSSNSLANNLEMALRCFHGAN